MFSCCFSICVFVMGNIFRFIYGWKPKLIFRCVKKHTEKNLKELKIKIEPLVTFFGKFQTRLFWRCTKTDREKETFEQFNNKSK